MEKKVVFSPHGCADCPRAISVSKPDIFGHRLYVCASNLKKHRHISAHECADYVFPKNKQ